MTAARCEGLSAPTVRLGGLILLVAAVLAAGAPSAAETLGRDVEETFHSRILGEDVALSIRLPSSYDEGEARYPVIYIMEHDLYFRPITGTVETYARLGKAPEMIVVGVGSNDRWRDFTPTRAGIPDGAELPTSGGSGAYRSFLLEEVVPLVEREYRTQPFSVLFGHSVAGLFVVTTMISGEGDFAACIATSPSLWWDDEVATRDARLRLASGDSLSGRMYLATGNEGATLLEPVSRFEQALSEDPSRSFNWELRCFDDADHQTMPLKAFAYGLDYVFSGWELPGEIREAGFGAVAAHYAELTAMYGYEIPVPERLANWFGYQELASGSVDEAIRIFEINVDAHPESANAYDSLAEAWLKAGDTERARLNYERSLALDPDNENARNVLSGLEGD